MRLLIVACILAFGLPGLALAQDQTTTKPSRGGHGGSVIKRDNGAGGPNNAGAALKGSSQQNGKPADQQPATPPKQ